MRNSIIVLTAILLLSFKNSKKELEVIRFKINERLEKSDLHRTELNGILGTGFVTAESGLLCRDKPNGKVIHKFPYGTEVEIINTTDQELTIIDDGKEITGYWAKVKIENTNKAGYVFDGFLTPDTYFNLDVEKIAKLTPATFVKVSNKKGLILDGIHNVYDKNLNVTRQIIINSISDVNILTATKFERPKTKTEAKRNIWQDYCDWAKYLEIIYNNEKLIVFGAKVLQIQNNLSYQFNNIKINFVVADSFLKKTGTLTEELSGCFCGSDFFIQSEENYSFVFNYESKEKESLFFSKNEYGSEDIYNTIIKNDTIFAKVEQRFQEGTGKYKLKIFNNNGWKFIGYDKTRDYNGQ